jgi:hypothetical protein
LAILIWIFPVQEAYTYFTSAVTSVDLYSVALSFLIGCALFIFFLLLKDKFVILELTGQKIKIKKGKTTIETSWIDVESISQIQFVQPPIYRLTLKNMDGYILFNTNAFYASFNGFTTDLSDMGSLIKKKKKELGI